MITSARGIRSSTVKKLKQQKMAGSNVPASSFRVSRPGRKRPVVVACFPGQQQPSNADKSSFEVLPGLPRTAHAAVSRPRVAAEIGLSRPAEDGGVGGSAGPSQDETRLLESPCKSRAPGASDGEESGAYRETADTTVDVAKETSSLTDSCRVGAAEEIELDSTTDPLQQSVNPVSLPVLPANSLPSPALRSPALFTILQRYLPLTVSRLKQSGDPVLDKKHQRNLQAWLDEPDDITESFFESETKDRHTLSKALPTATGTLSSRGCSAGVRPMDVESVLMTKRSISTHSTESPVFLETSKRPINQAERHYPGTPAKKHRKDPGSSKSTKTGGKKGTDSAEKTKVPKKPSPNAFVSLRIGSPSIRSGLEEVQRSMVEKDRAVKGVLTSLNKLHVTLSVIRLENKEEEQRAGVALLEATRELNARLDLYKEPLLLKISGLGSFGKNVVFAEIVEKEELRKIAGIVHAVFEAHGFQDLGRKQFNPHLTIAKMLRSQSGRGGRGGRGGRRRRELNGISEDLYAEFKERDFGVEKVTAIELLSMTYPPARDHYYHCFQQYSFKETWTHHKTEL